MITIVFDEGTDIYFARQLVFERLQEAREQIPEGLGIPEMGPNTSGLGQIFKYYLRTEDPSQYDAMTRNAFWRTCSRRRTSLRRFWPITAMPAVGTWTAVPNNW